MQGDAQHEMPPEERERLMAMMLRLMELGMGAVYGQEEPGLPDASIDCHKNLADCRAHCCRLNFALTKDEVSLGLIRHNPQRPFFIARDEDGYCPHIDRATLRCSQWDNRPLRCRRYSCINESPSGDQHCQETD